MNHEINQCQQRLFNKLFVTLPSVKKANEFNENSDFNFIVENLYFVRNKDFWFSRSESEDKYIFLFGIRDKPIKDICGNDVCLIIDFDKNIQFNNSCLGFFSIKNSEIHILINNKLLNERYPYINVSNFKISNFKSFDNSIDLEVIDLGNLGYEFIDNLRYLIKSASSISKSKKEAIPHKSSVDGQINEKPVKSDIESKIPEVIKTDSFGNKNTISAMNSILNDLANGESEDEAILHANVSKNTYKYWINRGKQEFGDIYIQFYNQIKELKSEQHNFEEETDEGYGNEVNVVDSGIYEPLLQEYEGSFSSMNQSGIAWVNKTGNKWTYSRIINGKSVKLSAYTIPELYKIVVGQDLVWGVRDYDKARKFIDIPDDFEIPLMPPVDEVDVGVDEGIYAPLSKEYEGSFSSMNQSGIAWVNKTGNKWTYSRIINGKSVKLSAYTIPELYKIVVGQDLVWGVRDYDKARKFIDIPDDFEIPVGSENGETEISLDNVVDESIYAPLSRDHLSKFASNINNKSGIAWVNKIGNNWYYQRQINGKTLRISDSNIIKLHEKVINNNQIWGVVDINKARKVIEADSIDGVDIKPPIIIKPIISNEVNVNYIKKSDNQFEIIIKGIIENNDLFDVLFRLKSFKENIKRIITTSINKETDILIELEMDAYSLISFEKEIKNLEWKINK